MSKLFENVPILTSLKMSPFSAVEFGWCCGTAVEPCGNCGKRFVLSKPLWESALSADFHQRRQFPQALRFFLFCYFFLSLCLSPVFHRKCRARSA
jgi:hypothetical protein